MLAGFKKGMLDVRPGNKALVPAILFTLGAFGSVCLSSTYVYLIEQAVCRKHFMVHEPARISSAGLVDEESCKIPGIQAQVASINGAYTFLAFLPALFFTGPYRQLTKILGRKVIMFLNICGFTIDSGCFVAVCYFYTFFDIRWIYLAPFLYVIGGGRVIFQSLIYTYISESVESKHLSGVLYKLKASQLLASFFGMALSSYLLRKNVWLQCLVGITTLLVMMPFTTLLPDSRLLSKEDADHSRTMEVYTDEISQKSSEAAFLLPHTQSPNVKRYSIPISISHALFTNMTQTLTLFKSIIKSSPLSRTTMLTYFLLSFANGIDVIFPQWSSLTFSWILADVNAVNSFATLVSFIVLLSLPSISSLLKPHFNNSISKVDLFIMHASVVALVIGVLCMALAPSRELLIAAVAVVNLGSGMGDATRGYVTGLIGGKEEVEQLYLGLGIMETLGGMLGTVVWSAAFKECVGRVGLVLRLPYVADSGLMVAALGCVVVLGRVGRRVRRVRNGV